MAALSDYLEDAIINWLRGTTFPAAPTTVYVALFTAAPNDAGGGTEVSGGGYARTAVTLGAPAGGAGATDNTATVTFPQASASWGTVTHTAIFDALTAGNLLLHGALAASKAVGDGDTAEFAIGDIDFTIA